VRSYKKLRAVRGDKPYELLDLFRQFATLNSGRLTADRRRLLQDSADLLEALHRDSELSFSLAELGEIINKDKSTVSRMLNSRNKSVRSHG